MFQCYRQKQNGINPFLLLACTIGALLIPSVSNDYKLSILAAPVAIFLTNNRFWEQTNGPLIHIIFIMLLLIFFIQPLYCTSKFCFLMDESKYDVIFLMLENFNFSGLDALYFCVKWVVAMNSVYITRYWIWSLNCIWNVQTCSNVLEITVFSTRFLSIHNKMWG